jgi:predicted ATPase
VASAHRDLDEGVVRITSVSGEGILSFDRFRLDMSRRMTFIVGPNGAGKSNLTRLLNVCQRAVECADGNAGDIGRVLASFVAARHVFAPAAIEVRVGLRLTDSIERLLVVQFVRAMVTGSIIQRRQVQNMADLDAWADAEITEDKLSPLMDGEIVARHPGTEDGQWQCWYEFTATGQDGSKHPYRWHLLGWPTATIVKGDAPYVAQAGSDIITRITGSSTPPTDAYASIPAGFKLLELLPHDDITTTGCTTELAPQVASGAQRRFAEMSGLRLASAGGSRTVTMARVLRVILGSALRQTTDMRLLPSGGTSWSSTDPTLASGAEVRLPEFLLALKNGDPGQRAQYRRMRALFTEFTQGRTCEIRLMEVPQTVNAGGEPGPPRQVPAVWVTVDSVGSAAELAPEVPVEFAGAAAWEAMVLATMLTDQAASVVVLDEPAVALHHNTQRKLAGFLEAADSQFIVISHSAELLPLSQAADVQLVRLDRERGATRAWSVHDACRVKMARKLAAKGNERLPFAARAVLTEGQDDQEAIVALCERMHIDVRQQNILITDCGSRDNLPDYISFCAQLGLRYLAVMDSDAGNKNALPKAQAVRDAILANGGGDLFEFPEYLEKSFGIGKHSGRAREAILKLPFIDDMPDKASVAPEIALLASAIQRAVN